MTQHCFMFPAVRQDNIATTGISAYDCWSHVQSNTSVYNRHTKLTAAPIPNNGHTTLRNLKDSMEHSPSENAQSSSASQEISRIPRNPKVYYCIHNSLPFVAITSHNSLAQTHRPTLFLANPFQYYSPIYAYHLDGLYPSGFPTKTCTILSSPHTCYVPQPSHYSWFHHSNNIW